MQQAQITHLKQQFSDNMKYSGTQEDALLAAHINDLAERAVRSCDVCYSRFLDEKQQLAVQKLFQGRTDCLLRLWGGYENAQRKICCVYNEWADFHESDAPLVCLTFRYRNADKLTHRDFLGAFMSCGIQRETVGDIITGDDKAQALVTQAVAPLLREITKIGRCGVKVSDDECFNMPCEQNFREISGTVSSLRIDSVAALGIRESREKTVKLLMQGRVELNYSEVSSSSLKVQEGDIFVVRGYGKFRLKKVTGLSKKGRLHILIEQYH
ncbi:MAG: RNA-binding protein [Ruminococcus sp.]